MIKMVHFIAITFKKILFRSVQVTLPLLQIRKLSLRKSDSQTAGGSIGVRRPQVSFAQAAPPRAQALAGRRGSWLQDSLVKGGEKPK